MIINWMKNRVKIFRESGKVEICRMVVLPDRSLPFERQVMRVKDNQGYEFNCIPYLGVWAELGPRRQKWFGDITKWMKSDENQ